MADWLDANLDALATVLGPGSGAARELLGAYPEQKWIPSATAGGPALQLRTAAGAVVAAHSRRAPDVEAVRLIDAALGGRPQPALAIVIGAGLGYVVDALLARDAETRVLVVEPDASGVAAFLGHRDWRPAIAAGRLLVLTGPDYRGADRAWRVVPTDDREPLVLVHPVFGREYPDAVREAGAIGVRVIADARANAGAAASLAAPYLLNTIENLAVVAREGDVDALAGAFAGVPAIVVAAGPSLDRVAADVARYADRTLVIAVDTAVRPLLARGIRPHLAVAVDPSERNARHLTGLLGAGGTWLVAEPSVHPRAFVDFAGRTFTFRVGTNHPWPWLAAQGVTRGLLAAWGSVLVSAFDLAVRVGARPIAIVGADLAYTGGQPYCRGTVFEEDWAREVRYGSRLDAIWSRVAGRPGAQTQRDVSGQPVPTLPHLVAFRDHLLERIRASGVRVVNATGGGILHGPGIEIAALADALAGAPHAVGVDARLRERHRQSSSETRASASAVQAALGRAGTPELLATGGPDIDVDRLLVSVERARAAIAEAPRDDVIGPPAATTPAASIDGPVWLPEQTAALASLVDPAAGHVSAGDISGSPSLADVVETARALLAHVPMAVGSVDLEAQLVDMLALPLPLLVPLADDARRDADRFGAAVTRLIRDRVGRGVPTPRPPFEPTWRFDARDSTVAPRSADFVGRLAASTTLAYVAARLGLASAAVDRVAAVLASGPPSAIGDVPRCARVTIAIDVGSGDLLPWAGHLALHPLARALAGTVVRAGDSPHGSRHELELAVTLEVAARDGWESVLGVGGRREARRLTPSPCGPCLFAATLDDRHAILSRVDGSGGYLVNAAGDVADAASWPAPIVAEAGWPATGGAFAWNAQPPRLLVRAPDGTLAHDVSLPFTPSSAAAEGHRIRFTALDGMWYWTAAEGPAQIAATVPLVAAHRLDDGTLVMAPLPYALDRPARVQTRHELTWSPDTGVRDGPPGPLGPCWSRAVQGGWAAEAFPDADLVRVSDAAGARAWVICEYPRSVAWAGASLVITSTSGDVWIVPGLRAPDTPPADA